MTLVIQGVVFGDVCHGLVGPVLLFVCELAMLTHRGVRNRAFHKELAILHAWPARDGSSTVDKLRVLIFAISTVCSRLTLLSLQIFGRLLGDALDRVVVLVCSVLIHFISVSLTFI